MDRARLRTAALLMLGTLVLGLAFSGSYVGALHAPKPHGVPVAVVGSAQAAQQLRSSAGSALDVRTVPDRATGLRQIDDRTVYGVLVPGQRRSRLYVASAAGAAVAQVLSSEIPAAARAQGQTVVVTDAHPLPANDSRGISPFYLAVGWIVSGYLGATVLGLTLGMSAGSRRRALLRLGALAVYALLGGILSAILVNGVIGTLGGHGVPLALIGALTVLVSATATAALEALLGIAGTGVVLLLFVVLGNPGSGGPYARDLLPGLWRDTGALLPPGGASEAIRNLVYFDGHALGGPLLVLALWAVVGAAVVVAVGHVRRVPSAAAVGAAGA